MAQGHISFVVPDVGPNNDYIVVRAYILFLVYLRRDAHFALAPRAVVGDSGDASQEFTIKAAEED